MGMAVDPSPESLARVRTRIASEPAPSVPWWSWKLVSAVAVAAGILMAVVVSRPQEKTRVAPAKQSDVAQAFRPAAPSGVAPGLGTRDSSVVSGFSRTVPSRLQPTRSAKAFALRSPEILFDRREVAAIQRLIAGVSDGRVDLTTLLNEAPPAPMELQPIADIVILPITIEPLAPAAGTGERQ